MVGLVDRPYGRTGIPVSMDHPKDSCHKMIKTASSISLLNHARATAA